MDHGGRGTDGTEATGGPPDGNSTPSGVDALTALSGRPDGPGLPPPAGLVEAVGQLGVEWGRRSALLGVGAPADPMRMLVERAALTGLRRLGAVSCGGSARLLRSADGWLAVNLARHDDWDLVDAWLQPDRPIRSGQWAAVASRVAGVGSASLVSRSTLLGLPVSALGERSPSATAPRTQPRGALGLEGVGARRCCPGEPAALDGLVVVDLSALWAGPLAAGLLAAAGARVIKVESRRRPDGARSGSRAFFARLNHRKESVALDFGTADGHRRLGELVSSADVVVSAARPRALEQLGLVPDDHLRRGGTRVWLSVTGYGCSGPAAQRVAFGDDAAVAGGLVVWDDEGPCFCGDAIADPLSGITGAVAVLAALERGGGWNVDVSMADVAAGCSRAGATVATGGPVALSPAVPGPGRSEPDGSDGTPRPLPAPALGADTGSVLSSLGIR